MFYFDPDICIVEKWSFFEEWLSCGIAVCEDINSPYPENHPRRIGWRRYFGPHAFNLVFRCSEYANGGLVGVRRHEIAFLHIWSKLQKAMAEEIGSLNASKLNRGKAFASKGFADCFDSSDQDALNAAIEASMTPVSILGREAMGFKQGAPCALHALGRGKPWQRSYLFEALKGNVPRPVDKAFWQAVDGRVRPYSPLQIMAKRCAIQLASMLGRFYRRSV